MNSRDYIGKALLELYKDIHIDYLNFYVVVYKNKTYSLLEIEENDEILKAKIKSISPLCSDYTTTIFVEKGDD